MFALFSGGLLGQSTSDLNHLLQSTGMGRLTGPRVLTKLFLLDGELSSGCEAWLENKCEQNSVLSPDKKNAREVHKDKLNLEKYCTVNA